MKHRQYTNKEAFEKMLSLRGRSSVSLIVPLFHLNPDHHEDWSRIDQSVHAALSGLADIDSEVVAGIRNTLSSISSSVTFDRNNKGLGIYVTDEFSYIAYFPFPVKASVTISDVFQVKELCRLSQYSAEILLLAVSSGKARLFRVLDRGIREVGDANFPMVFEDDREYELPSLGTSFSGYTLVKGFEKDKSVVRKKRFRDFLKKLDDTLESYISPESEIILSGTSAHIAELRSVSRHGSYFCSESIGGYNWYDAYEYNALLWPVLRKRIGEKVIDMLEYYSRRAGEGFSEHGMTQVWNAVMEGRVDTLLVEIDFETEGYFSRRQSVQYEYSACDDAGYDYFPKAVNELVQLVALRKSRIFFLDRDLMPSDSHVAAICRY